MTNILNKDSNMTDYMPNKNSGEAKNDFLIFIGLVFFLFVIWILTGGPTNFNPNEGLLATQNFISALPTVSADPPIIDKYSPADQFITLDNIVYHRSPWYGLVKIGRGNAKSAIQPREEYITLSASLRNAESITITGWILENGNAKKIIYSNGNTFAGVSKKVALPAGTNLFGGTNNEPVGPITLNPGDRAIIITGSFPPIDPIPIKTSFRTNLCTGYLDALPNYQFYPSLGRSCPAPKSELSKDVFIEDKCFSYISRLDRCHTPDTAPFLDRTKDGFTFVNNYHLDKISGFSSQCRDFVLSHYNYHSCVAKHLLDENFYGSEWRIFLNQPFELWGKDREVITLYDNQGKIVDQLKY